MNNRKHKPSKFALAFFNWYCHPDYREEIEGDLMERFNTYSQKYGHLKANRLFIKDVVYLFRPAIVGNIYHLTNTDTMEIFDQNKRLVTIVFCVLSVLFIPFIAMNFTTEVQWNTFDFIIAGILLLSTGLILELILRRIKTMRNRILFGSLLFLIFILVWAELAVGIFGTPFAGS